MAEGDSPPSLWPYVVGVVGTLSAAVALLWRSSRTDADARIAAQAEQIKEHQARERESWKDREAAAEARIRMAAAMEALAVAQRDVISRLERIESGVKNGVK